MSADTALLVDFGSTYTKLRAVELGAGRIVGTGQGPSTVTTDITIGMEAALADLGRRMGGLPAFRHRLASSSAAGGLRMVTVGLVRELTAEAARRAALGAGARLVGCFAYRLTERDVAEIESLAPDVLLLAGGTDGGNGEVILHNAKRLADSSVACPVIAAGNREAADAIRAMFEAAGKPVILAGNVMPEFNRLDIDPARAAIRQVFIDRIVHAKGIDRAAAMLDSVLMPTPAAVMEGARLLAEGTGTKPGLGELLVVDIGGATTDVHSVAAGEPSREGVIRHGLPEPYVQRTVEGDLGMRHNAAAIVEAAGIGTIAVELGAGEAEVEARLARIGADVEWLPESDADFAFERALARAAVRIAVRRHAGETRIVYTATGPATVQTGKDLSRVSAVIGTGGALVHGPDPAGILAAALADPDDQASLRPAAPTFYLDSDYLLYAVGLLAAVEPETALAMGLAAMTELETESSHGKRGTG